MTGDAAPRRVTPRYESFPQDGAHYWLRWLDGIDPRGHGSGSPTIHAHLSLLTDLRDGWRLPPLADVAGPGASPLQCAVPVASLPDLHLGTVFKNGVAVGALEMVPRTFAFARPSCTSAIMRCDDLNPAPKPDWWTAKWTMLPAKAYALGRLRGAHCLVLRDRKRQLLIPASEVFGVFCGPESRLAEALLSAPWRDVRERVINPTWTEELDSHWEIGLRTGLTARSALPAAAFEFTKYGRAVAGLIQASLIGQGARLRDLKADIPYDWAAVELGVEGVAFPDEHGSNIGLDRFLGLRITGVRWTKPLLGLPRELSYRLDNYNTVRDPGPSPLDEVRIVPRSPAPQSDGVDGTVPVDPGVSASAGVDPLSSGVSPGPTFEGGPKVVRMLLAEPVSPPRPRVRIIVADPADNASPTWSGPGIAGAAQLRHVADPREAVTGFRELADALDFLVDAGSIDEWGPITPLDDRWAVRDGLPAWCFPGHSADGRIAWAYVDGSKRRTALVCRIVLAGRLLHAVEIERRPRMTGASPEGFNMLLMEVADADRQPAMACLLRLAGDRRGVWPDDAAWAAAGMVSPRIARRRHDYIGFAGASPDQAAPRRLDPVTLLRWMRRFQGIYVT